MLRFLANCLLLGSFFTWIAVGGTACKNDKPVALTALDSTLIDSAAAVQAPLPTPVASPVVEQEVDKQTASSPFKDLGCCGDKEKRKAENCCCEQVIEAYRKMKQQKAEGIGRLKMNDPILSVCRQKHKKIFEEIDNPPPPPGKKIDTEELY